MTRKRDLKRAIQRRETGDPSLFRSSLNELQAAKRPRLMRCCLLRRIHPSRELERIIKLGHTSKAYRTLAAENETSVSQAMTSDLERATPMTSTTGARSQLAVRHVASRWFDPIQHADDADA